MKKFFENGLLGIAGLYWVIAIIALITFIVIKFGAVILALKQSLFS